MALAAAAAVARPADLRWTPERAAAWYAGQPWLVGANYIPANAINELEMWQADTFDPKRIDLELGWAEAIGMNTMRVFLHDRLWDQDPAGFRGRIDCFLQIAERHRIRPMLVLFDSCWDPEPRLGPQHAPVPGVHNSGWVQSPGREALRDPGQRPRLEAYITGVVAAFAQDPRVLCWDVWNEPDGVNGANRPAYRDDPRKVEQVLDLLPLAFAWARAARPSQPLTSAVMRTPWLPGRALLPVEKVQLDQSDIISFHNYGPPERFEEEVRTLLALGRPVLCTEYMARTRGSTFAGVLPIAKRHRVGAINWGLVAGKTQTYLPWDSWDKPYVGREPAAWFHEVFRTDGSPYRGEETELIRSLTSAR